MATASNVRNGTVYIPVLYLKGIAYTQGTGEEQPLADAVTTGKIAC